MLSKVSTWNGTLDKGFMWEANGTSENKVFDRIGRVGHIRIQVL